MAGTISELLQHLAPDRPLQERIQACDSLLPLVVQAGLEDGLAPTDTPQLLGYCLSMLQLQPSEIPSTLFRLLQELARSSGSAKVIIRGPSLDRLAALLRQVETDALLSILALLDALAAHAKYLGDFAKSNVIFELLAILEDLKPKSAGKRRAASLLLMTLFHAPACCEQVSYLHSEQCCLSIRQQAWPAAGTRRPWTRNASRGMLGRTKPDDLRQSTMTFGNTCKELAKRVPNYDRMVQG